MTPLRDQRFRLFFTGEMINNAGASMANLALVFAVLAIDNSAAAVGWVAAASTVPMVAFMLIGGAIGDRLPRTLVLRGCNLGQGVLQAIAATLVLTGAATVWELVILQFIGGTLFAVSYPAFHGMVPILLPEEERKAAYLLMGQSDSALRIAGPAIAGVLVATAGPGWGLAIDASTYFVAAVFLGLLKLPFGKRPEQQPSVIGDFATGWSYVRGLGWVLPIACCSLVFNALISGAIGVLGPVIAEGTIGSDGWGFARAGQAVGMFLVTLVLARMPLRFPLRLTLIGFSTSAIPMLILAGGVNTPALTAGFMVAGAGLGLINLAWSMTVQEKVREDMLSRVMAIDGFFSFVAMPLGQVLVGPLAGTFGNRDLEYAGAALCIVVLVVGMGVRPIRRLRLEGVERLRA